ncbi:PREDICTED: putative protein TPRXL [Prunus mume]|uniref:Serine-rich protein-like protein n=1 Tax=Prunus mume TaxID=102107 RepID=A0ABM0NRI5_PRUMU|nr:PREDICTED: putative protein TPRXL [Prunus mume]
MALASSRSRSDTYSCRKSQPLFSSSSSGFASSTSSSFSSATSTFFNRSASPTRLSVYDRSPSPSSSSLRFTNRSGSPGRSISVQNHFNHSNKNNYQNGTTSKKTCLCSPTTHPGSFRCALHKNSPSGGAAHHLNSNGRTSSYHSSIRLNYRRSAMKNSLVRIGGVEGDLVKRALSALIRPSSHSQKRKVDFQPKPSRLSVMSKASDDDDDDV